MNPVVLSFSHNEELGKKIVEVLSGDKGEFFERHFPDGETYVRVLTAVKDRDVIIVCSLERPDDKLLPLCFLAGAAREAGARSVGLIAPYLAYMRQDRSFNLGEAISSEYFGKIISTFFSWLITVDPHLHRYPTLAKVYSIPTHIVHAAPLIANYIRKEVVNPVIVGPDRESAQWIREVASAAHAGHIVLSKERLGDKDVKITLPPELNLETATPVLVDDIISTGHTMQEVIKLLMQHGFKAPVCVGVHGIFAENAYEELLKSGAQAVVTTNTIHHVSNKIDVSELLLQAASDAEFFRFDSPDYLKNIQSIIEHGSI